MGQKVNPISLRLPINKRWDSKAFFDKFNYASLLHQDLQIQRYVHGVLFNFQVLCNRCVIKRVKDTLYINVFFYVKSSGKGTKHFVKVLSSSTKKAGKFKKGKSSKSLDKNTFLSMTNILEKSLLRLTQSQVKIRFIPLYSSSNKRYNRSLLYIERSMRFLNSLSYIHLFDTSLSTKNASLLAQFIALNLHLHIRNVRFFLRFLDRLMNLFVKHYSFKGIKLCIKGRLNGARRARSLVIQKGKVPLNTLSSNISFGFANSMTIYGICGVKVWLYF